MSTCRSCGAAIVWMVTTAGKPMPCDAEQVRVAVPTGNLVDTGHGVSREVEIRTGWVPHWATCADAEQHRGLR